jgi:chorismate synthase
MMGNTFGNLFRITTWGESHGKAIGCVVDGCPAGLELSEEDIQVELDRRKPGKEYTSTRKEEDRVSILSGVFEGRTTGAPISMIILNKDVISEHYLRIKDSPRPGHADLTYWLKYRHRDWRGGGRSSARETAGRVAGGTIAKKLISSFGVKVVGYAVEIGGVGWKESNENYDEQDYLRFYEMAEESPLRIPDRDATEKAIDLIESIRKEGDSVGGIAEVVVLNPPPGLGEPVFNRFDAALSMAVMSIPAVKGVEIGTGFRVSRMKGSENNDPIILKDGKIRLAKNHSGGILGGITTGEPIIIRAAIKPTPSISKPQRTVNLERMEEETIKVEGRHDPCIVPRVIPVIEAMVAITVADFMLMSRIIPQRIE